MIIPPGDFSFVHLRFPTPAAFVSFLGRGGFLLPENRVFPLNTRQLFGFSSKKLPFLDVNGAMENPSHLQAKAMVR